MASSSAAAAASCSSSRPKWKYEVFLSFRGEDTRNTFTSHLNDRLDREGIHTFLDDKRLEEGSTIFIELCRAIEESQVAVIIFSKNYASSSWCLDELVKIMECKNKPGKTVIPVFYDVDPSTVRKQTKSFAEAFAKHESRFNEVNDVEGEHRIQGWKTALTEAAGLKGHDICNRNEAECIHEIVAQIFKLCRLPSSSLEDVVGFNFHLEKITPLLKLEFNDVRILGIWGMGGVGKTTIARAIFETFSDQFKASCFLGDIKEKKRDELHSLQNILFSKLLSKDFGKVDDKCDGERILKSRLRSKKVFVVLDDVDHRDHLKYLAGDRDWFGEGSRIIVTTRDEQLIRNKVDAVYELTTLPKNEAFQLFNQHAFKDKVPAKDFESLSWEVVNHAKGLPLALVVWGSFLNSERDIDFWRSAVKRMKDDSKKEIVEQLKISYDGLETQEQEIFLDLACLFRGEPKDYVVPILESFDFDVTIGLKVLISKSLVFISYDNNIEMHDLIQDMGKRVVKLEKKYSRIWRKEDFERLMINNTGTEPVEAIQIYLQPNFQLSKKAMKNMNNLRYLHLQIQGWMPMTFEGGSIKYLSNSLCWLDWSYYPAESLPAKFKPKKLVHLHLQYGKLRRLWTGEKDLPKLRTLDLSGSCELEQTPDFTKMKNLEILCLSVCTSLKEVHQSLGYCTNLTKLDLSECKKLESLPEEIGDLENLQELDARCTAISQPPSSIVRLNKLEHLSFREQNSELAFVFPRVNEGLRSLKVLDLGYCNLIDGGLPEDIGSLSSLQILHLQGNHFEHLPQSIVSLSALQFLNLRYCSKLKELPELPPNIVELLAHYHLAKGSIKILVTKSMKLQRIIFTCLSDFVDESDIDDESDNDFPNDESSYNEMNDSLSGTLSGYIDALSASDPLQQRMFTVIRHPSTSIPSLFDLQEVKPYLDYDCRFELPKDWYVRGNFFGFAVCLVVKPYNSFPIDALTLLSDDNQSNHDEPEPQSVALDIVYEELYHPGAYFLFVPFNSIWDESKANGKTPNDYGLLMLDTDRWMRGDPIIRGHLIYKKGVGIGKRRRGSYEDGESSSKIRRHFCTRGRLLID